MITLNLPIYKVVIRYNYKGRDERDEEYFLDYFKALAYAERQSKLSYVAMHELEEDENGTLVSCKCIRVW